MGEPSGPANPTTQPQMVKGGVGPSQHGVSRVVIACTKLEYGKFGCAGPACTTGSPLSTFGFD